MAHMDKCGKCDKEIEGKVIRITGSVFHPDCFTCEVSIDYIFKHTILLDLDLISKLYQIYVVLVSNYCESEFYAPKFGVTNLMS